MKKTKKINHIFIILLVILITTIRIFVCDLICIKGFSMQPNFQNKEIVFVDKMKHDFNRFDVVIVKTSKGQMIKRIVGFPGDVLQIIDGDLYINQEKIDVVDVDMEYAGVLASEYTVLENEYFVLGDNRNNSYDSRYPEIGPIRSNKIVGFVSFKIIDKT